MDDRPGQLAKVAESLAEHGVSLATVSQTPDDDSESASIILTTHQTNEHSIALAIRFIGAVRRGNRETSFIPNV